MTLIGQVAVLSSPYTAILHSTPRHTIESGRCSATRPTGILQQYELIKIQGNNLDNRTKYVLLYEFTLLVHSPGNANSVSQHWLHTDSIHIVIYFIVEIFTAYNSWDKKYRVKTSSMYSFFQNKKIHFIYNAKMKT